MSDIERELRDSLAENARHAPTGDGLAERIIAEARRGVPEQRTGRSRWRAWALPAIAAACVAGVVAAIAIAGSLQHRKAHSAHSPSFQVTPPATTSTPAPSTMAATTSAPASPVTSSAPTSTAPASGSVPKGFKVADLTFVGAKHGWALGTGECVKDPSQSCRALVHTADGGLHWESLGTPPPPGTEHIRFANDHTGYAYGSSALAMTTDGGASWTPQQGGADALETLSGNVIRVTAGGCAAPGCSYQVLTAAVGSDQWQSAQLPGNVSGDSVVLSRTGHAAYLLIRQNPAGGAGSALPTLLTSSDDGRSWTEQKTLCPQDPSRYGEVDANLMTTAEDGSVSLVCAARGNWSSQFTVSASGSGAPFRPGARNELGGSGVEALGAASGSVLLASTDDTYRSTDSGRSWHPLGASGPGRVSWIGFENATVGRAISEDGHTIWTTTDAGATWSSHTFR